LAETPSNDQARKKSCPARARGLAFKLAALGLVAVSALAGTGLARWLRSPGTDAEEGPAVAAGKMPAGLFRGWPKGKKPDLVLVITGQQHGYLLPCGCSEPQIGGLERRYNFLKLLEREGWPVVALDLGDVVQEKGVAWLPNQQALVKYRFAMDAMNRMKYAAVALGETEAVQTYFRVLGEWPLNHPNDPLQVVSANLIDADKNFPDQTKPVQYASAGGVRVGVTSITSPLVAAGIKKINDPTMRFSRGDLALNKALLEMNGKADLRVLLYQGALTRNDFKRPPTEAMAAAELYPQFPLVVCLSSEDEPPALPFKVTAKGGTTGLVIQVGRRGKFLGVVGVYRTGNPSRPFDFHYQMVEMTPAWATPDADKNAHPIVQMMEEYAKEIKRDNYMSRYGGMTHPLQAMEVVKDGGAPVVGKGGQARPTFVGSAACKSCHPKAYKIWKNSKHSHAYETLVVRAKHPSNRQFDPECIVCHTVGFGFNGGFRDTTTTPLLTDVGCESCHGPASIHVRNKDNVEWQKRLNPWRHLPAAVREREMNLFCQKCHDADNDVTWLKVGFKKKWQMIAH
jgi:hypothetical protein